MSRLIPERPIYRRERLLVGYPTLAVFVLLFVSYLLFDLTALADRPYLKLIPMVVALLAPALIFWMARGSRYTPALRLRAPRASHIPFLVSGFFVLLCGCMLLSILCGGTGSMGNSMTAFETTGFSSVANAILMTTVLAVVPALLPLWHIVCILRK